MEEMNNSYSPAPGPVYPPKKVRTFFMTGRKELIFGILIIACSLLLCNFTLFGGYNMGFALAALAYIGCATVYHLITEGRLTVYSGCLLLLSAVIAAGFARSDDGFVKFVMVGFLTVSVNLALCITAGQNRRRPGGITSLLDVPRTIYVMGYGQLPRSFRGLFHALRGNGSMLKKFGALILGLLIMLPVLGIVVPLLMSADAAFSGLMKILPSGKPWEIFLTLPFAVPLACILYTRSVALRHRPKQADAKPRGEGGLNSLTVNTVLVGLSLVYLLYLFSQLAYVVGGFAGILPEEYTMAEYARRGFFEMAVLCGIDLGVVALAIGLVRRKNGKAPLVTRLLCLFIGVVTVFMVATASAKMFMYIGAYGLTRLRVMTELIMLFLGLATALVCLWLFVPKLRYMQLLLVIALLMGAAVIWVDVDTTVAAYNVSAYQSGRMEKVDVKYLGKLSDGAIPYIAQLANDEDPDVAVQARAILQEHDSQWENFRDWNYANAFAQKFEIRDQE